ncbi:hypothetical protein G9A89_013636 [Geosiphon pyriformis]|nr:hypothetical protein G9A89_013636 [Geosiphon pyriformis]
MNIQLCEKYIMPCDDKWCSECYALSIFLPSKNDQKEIEFRKLETKEKIATTLIYLIKNQPAIQLKYFDNGKRIKPEKTHEINTEYDLRYPGKNTLVFQSKSLTKINLKIAFEILPGAMVQIASKSLLASKKINIRGGVIDAEYTGNITIIEQLGKSERGTQDFGSTGRFTVPVNIALNAQNESHQILQLPQPITILLFEEHHEIYTCSKPTTTQQIFEFNEQICLKHKISIPNVYILKEMKKF